MFLNVIKDLDTCALKDTKPARTTRRISNIDTLLKLVAGNSVRKATRARFAQSMEADPASQANRQCLFSRAGRR